MIKAHSSDCCGCGACAQICPKQCISIQADGKGFLHPCVNTELCIDCGLCEKVCPVLTSKQSHEPLKFFAAKNPDGEVRRQSSSGGVFSMLAERTIKDGGVVFGALFDEDWNVLHDYTETIKGLSQFRGSKYVQSRIGDCFIKAKSFLSEGRKVLFSGTPCQIAGLKLFLGKEYENLLTVECVCHGVPSVSLWNQYLNERASKDKQSIRNIKSIDFRDKVTGWRNYSFTIEYMDGSKYSVPHDINPWVRAFIRNLDLRPSCYKCKFKTLQSFADITIGDLWGVEYICPQDTDNKGLTLVIVHTKKGLESCSICSGQFVVDFELVGKYNKALVESPVMNEKSQLFWDNVSIGFIKTVQRLTKDPFILRCKIFFSKLIRRIR